MTLEFGILGPLEVYDDDRRLPVRGAKQRLVLGVLLLHANEVVSTELLIDTIWGERPPETAVKALQVHISQLRKLLAVPVIETRPPGYLLRVEDDRLDLARFERLRGVAARTRAPRDRARILTEALALWRGPALADVERADALRGELAGLETLRLYTLESRIAADLACGRHGEVVPELQTLVARHPLRERLRANLMLALYRSGRQADALAVYGDTRARLVTELGVEPGRELRDLQAGILAQDPALDLLVDARAAGLIGREREMALLRPVVDRAVAGNGVAVLLSGEPGIGKSRLAEALTAYAVAQGAVAALGRCWEAGGAPTYGPWVQAIRTATDALDPAMLRDVALTEFIPELAGESAPRRDDGSRFRLFAAVARLLRKITADRSLVLWVEDLHAADAGSIDLLRYLVADLAGSPVVVIGTYRDTEDGQAAALAELAREPAVHPVRLAGLSASDTIRLLEGTAGEPVPPGLAARIVTQTEGNPLFAVEMGRLVAAQGRDRQVLPRRILDVIGQRVGHRSDACRETLVLASVIGREFDVDTLVEISPLEEEDVFAALDEAVAAGLVDDLPEAPGRLRFSHMMVRDALYDGLTPHRRLRLHRHVADGLEAVYGSGAGPHVAELAHHYLAAGRGSADKAVEYSVLAGDRAASQFAHREAAVHYATALDILRTPNAPDRRRECELLVTLGEARSRAGDTAAAKPLLREAAASAQAAGWPEPLARAALAYGGRLAWARACTDPALTPLLRDALNAVHHATDAASAQIRVRLLGRLAAARRDDRSRDERLALAREAVDISEHIDDPAAQAFAIEGYFVAAEGPDGVAEQLELADRIIALGGRAGDPEIVYSGHQHRLTTLMTLGDRAAADAEATVITRLVTELRQPAQLWEHVTFNTALALLEGRFAEAEALIASTAELGGGSMSWNAAVSRTIQLFVLRRAQGRLDELEPIMRDAVHRYPTLMRFRCALAHLHAELGQAQEARAAFDAVLPSVLAGDHVDAEWLVAVCLLPDVCAFLTDTAAAAELYTMLLPYRHLYANAPAETAFGSVERALGVLAAVSGRGAAVEHLTAAAATEERMRAAPWLAHARHDLARVLHRRHEDGDAERVTDLRNAATALYRRLGMNSWAARCAAPPT